MSAGIQRLFEIAHVGILLRIDTRIGEENGKVTTFQLVIGTKPAANMGKVIMENVTR